MDIRPRLRNKPFSRNSYRQRNRPFAPIRNEYEDYLCLDLFPPLPLCPPQLPAQSRLNWPFYTFTVYNINNLGCFLDI